MKEDLYIVTVSSLEVRKQIPNPSKVYLERNAIVRTTGKTKQYKKQSWIEIVTVKEPTVVGFIQQKYLTKI